MKKTIVSILLIMMMVLPFNFVSATEERTMEVTLGAKNEAGNIITELEAGQEFYIVAYIGNFSSNVGGINAMLAQLEYSTKTLDYLGIQGEEGWSVSFYKNKFVADTVNDELVNKPEEPVATLRIKFKVKEKKDLTSGATATIKLKGIQASGGNGLITATDAQKELQIKVEEEPPVEPKILIESEKYDIDTKDGFITRIIPGTTVKTLKENIKVLRDNVVVNDIAITVEDANGNPVEENAIIKTGMKVKVGTTTLNYTASVIGDVDGDGQITVNDLAKVKLHYIEDTLLTGAYLKSADVDGAVEDNKPVGINDIGKIKLVLIEKEVIK